MFVEEDYRYMQQALDLARQSMAKDEVPVGAVLVHHGEVIAAAHNQTIHLCDPSAHAEMLVLRQAGQRLQNYRLLETSLYVSLEPCMMCAAAMVHARIKRLIFAAADPKTGACGSVINLPEHRKNNHKIDCQGGLLAEESGQLLRDFFRSKR